MNIVYKKNTLLSNDRLANPLTAYQMSHSEFLLVE